MPDALADRITCTKAAADLLRDALASVERARVVAHGTGCMPLQDQLRTAHLALRGALATGELLSNRLTRKQQARAHQRALREGQAA